MAQNAAQQAAAPLRTEPQKRQKPLLLQGLYASGCGTMPHGANTPSGEDRIRTKGTNPENEQDSVLSAAKSAAVDAENPPLDPQLQLLIERWPTLSKAVQQQIMLLVG